MTEWSTADILMGKMLIGGPRPARFCPFCKSPEVTTGKDRFGDPTIKCDGCGFKGAGAIANA